LIQREKPKEIRHNHGEISFGADCKTHLFAKGFLPLQINIKKAKTKNYFLE